MSMTAAEFKLGPHQDIGISSEGGAEDPGLSRKMSRRESLARFLMGGSRSYQDAMQPYEQLCVHRVRREQPKYGAPIYPEMPMWEWQQGSRAREILEFLGLDPEEMIDA